MSKSKGTVWLGSSLAAMAMVLAGSSAVFANNPGGGPRSEQSTPAGFTKFLVYLGESVAEPGEPSLFMDEESAYYFQSVIMERTDEEIEADRQAAKDYFNSQFGLDFSESEEHDGAEWIDGAFFTGFMQNPDANYRAYTVSGDWVPADGWMVRDGGWAAVLTDEDGMYLHGEYGGEDGKWAPAGTMFVFGDYNIKVERPQSGAPPHSNETIEIHYESPVPLIENADGVLPFVCNLEHDEWGPGRARGLAHGGVIRNVLTFPPDLQD